MTVPQIVDGVVAPAVVIESVLVGEVVGGSMVVVQASIVAMPAADLMGQCLLTDQKPATPHQV